MQSKSLLTMAPVRRWMKVELRKTGKLWGTIWAKILKLVLLHKVHPFVSYKSTFLSIWLDAIKKFLNNGTCTEMNESWITKNRKIVRNDLNSNAQTNFDTRSLNLFYINTHFPLYDKIRWQKFSFNELSFISVQVPLFRNFYDCIWIEMHETGNLWRRI
jgi:hypothetical protein